MANTTDSQTYTFSFKLVPGYNVISLPNNIITPNLKNITIKKISYNFNQSNQYVAKLSIIGYDLQYYSDGVVTNTYSLSFFNPSGAINSQINYVNYSDKSDIVLKYGSPLSQFTLSFDTDYSTIPGSLGVMSTGGSSFVTSSNPLFIEIEFK